jgi:type IV secretory pathway VirB6-like protein
MLLRRASQILKVLALLVLSGGMAGCSSGPLTGYCVQADDFGDIKYASLLVDARGAMSGDEFNGDQWIDSGLEVVEGRRLQIQSFGTIELCANQESTYTAALDPTYNGWVQMPNVSIVDESVTRMEISASGYFCQEGFSENCTDADSCTPIPGQCKDLTEALSDESADGKMENGEGVVFYIGNAPPAADWVGNPSRGTVENYSAIVKANSDDEGPDDKTVLEKIPSAVVDESVLDGHRDVVGDWDGVVGGDDALPEGTALYFRIVDNWADVVDYKADNSCSGSNGCANPWRTDADYANNDNEGNIIITVKVRRECHGRDGQFLLALIGKEDGTGTTINLHNNKIVSGGGFVDPVGGTGTEFSQGLFNGFAPASGKLLFKVLEDPDYDWDSDGSSDESGNRPLDYSNNRGTYSIEAKTAEPSSAFSANVINGMVDAVKETMFGASDGSSSGLIGRLYNGVVKNTGFIDGVRAVIALSIVLIGLGYVLGVTQFSQREFGIYILKLGLVFTVISDTSWEFFYKHLYALFIDGIDELIFIFSSPISEVLSGAAGIGTDASLSTASATGTARDAFAFLNETLGRFWTSESWGKMLGLLTMFPMGIIYFFLMFAGIIIYMIAVAKAVLIYILSLVMIGLLLFVGPMVIVFSLFGRTQEIFSSWIKYLMNFAIQPVVVFAVLSIFNAFIYTAFYLVLAYNVCWRCVWMVDLPVSELWDNVITGDFDRFCITEFFIPWGQSGSAELSQKLMNTPVGWFAILIFLILASVMSKLIDWVVMVSGVLTAGSEPANLLPSAGRFMGEVGRGVKGTGTFAKRYGEFMQTYARIGRKGVNEVKKANTARRDAGRR